MALGLLNPAFSFFTQPGLSTSYTGEHVLPQDERGLGHPNVFDFGAFVDVNSNPVSQSYGGDRAFSFIDDFYFRIYLLPNAIDFGAVVAATNREITVWNAYFTDQTLLSVVPFDGTQVTFIGDDIPYALGALNLHSWNFHVTPEGPPTIEDAFTFTFDTGEVFQVQISGTRSLLWPFLPDWAGTYTVTRSFNTNIFASRDGTEQRTAFRQASRKTHAFNITNLNAAALRRYRQLMAYWQDRPFLVADATRTAHTSTQMNAGDDTVQLDTTVTWLEEDQAVVFTNTSRGLVGLRIVDSVDSAGLVTFKDTDDTTWPIDSIVSAGIVANLTGDKQGVRVLNTAQTTPVTFFQLPGTQLEQLRAPTDFFNGRELFLGRPNWGEQVGAIDTHPVETVDYGIGVITTVSPISFSSQIWSGTYLGRDADTVEELLHFFERMRGRQGEFYMPTWEYDIPVAAPLVSGTQGLRTPGTDFLTAYGGDTTSQAVLVLLKDGTQVFRAIETMIEINDSDGDDTLIQMTELWGSTIPVDSIDRVSWVRVWRFATDDLTAEFVTNSVANMQLSMQSLPDLPAEELDSET